MRHLHPLGIERIRHKRSPHAIIAHVVKAHLNPSDVPFYCMRCNARCKTEFQAWQHRKRFHKEVRGQLKALFSGMLTDLNDQDFAHWVARMPPPDPIPTMNNVPQQPEHQVYVSEQPEHQVYVSEQPEHQQE